MNVNLHVINIYVRHSEISIISLLGQIFMMYFATKAMPNINVNFGTYICCIIITEAKWRSFYSKLHNSFLRNILI